jgi:hypothetical protein
MRQNQNIEYRTAEQETAEVSNDHFDIQNSLFDILRFVGSAKEKGSRHIGMSLLLLNETPTVTMRLFPP